MGGGLATARYAGFFPLAVSAPGIRQGCSGRTSPEVIGHACYARAGGILARRSELSHRAAHPVFLNFTIFHG